ncbi:DMT family transporter [Heyndrickxia acidiproducens]|uniref:DMT family transporter n=1 Tax=Heyndrickxia acidiproducens TaxID=1121084 RepID=UPI0003776AA7|nr:DMT family transporter [Heyndrickxia acidiproducens]
MPVFPFLFIRFTLTVIIMILFTWRKLKNATKDTWFSGIIFGLFLAGIFTSETWGINYTSAANSGFLISLTVVFTPVIESLALKKPLKIGIIGAVILSCAGTFFLTIKHGGYSFNIGDILILVAALLRATQMAVTQKLTNGKEMDSGSLTTIQLGVVAIVMGILTVLLNGKNAMALPPSFSFWILTIYLAIFGTLLAFYIQLAMIRKTSPTRVGLLMGTEPVFSAVFAILIGGESLIWQQWLGGALIVIGTYYGRYVETNIS